MKKHREQHGMKHSPEYQPWLSMVQRCTNPNEKNFAQYGGAGIGVCAEWRNSFRAFYQHIGPRPSMNHTIERINNERGYEPGNVRWATRQDQSKNRKTTIWVEWGGERLCLKDAAQRAGVSYRRAQVRVSKLGWSTERALTTPPRRFTAGARE